MIRHTFGRLVLLAGLLAATCSALAQAGVPLWTNRYNGPDDRDDWARAVAVDKAGQIYVTGATRSAGQLVTQTIKYDSNGLPLWTNHFGEIAGVGYDIALGRGGQGVYVLSASFLSQIQYSLIAYSPDGAALWTNRYSIPNIHGALFLPAGIASDVSSGNVYLTETTEIFSGDIFTIAYSHAGTPLWTNFFSSSPQGLSDKPAAIGVGSNGNIHVGGTSAGNWVTLAYTPGGDALWTNWFGGEMNNYDRLTDLAVVNNGDVVFSGTIDDDDRVAMVRYSSTGVPMWTNIFEEPNGVGSPPRVVAANSGNVHVAWTWDEAFATIACASNGTPIWTNYFFDSDGIAGQQSSLIADSDGNVYACLTTSSEIDWMTIAYSASGETLWTNRSDGFKESGDDNANGIAVSDKGEVYVVGNSDGPNDGRDWAVIKYAGIKPSPIELRIQQQGNKVITSWPDSRFALQAAPTLAGTFTNILGATSPYTNVVTGTQQFFRLVVP